MGGLVVVNALTFRAFNFFFKVLDGVNVPAFKRLEN